MHKYLNMLNGAKAKGKPPGADGLKAGSFFQKAGGEKIVVAPVIIRHVADDDAAAAAGVDKVSVAEIDAYVVDAGGIVGGEEHQIAGLPLGRGDGGGAVVAIWPQRTSPML